MLALAYSKHLLGAFSFRPTGSSHASTGRYGLPLPARTRRCLGPESGRAFEPESGDAEPSRGRVKRCFRNPFGGP